MDREATIDLLRVILDREAVHEPPLVETVRYNVRSGISMPTKTFMAQNDIVAVSWDFPFSEAGKTPFAQVIPGLEAQVADKLKALDPLFGEPLAAGTDENTNLMFHGVFPARAGNATISRLRALWSGRRTAVSILGDWRLGSARPTQDAGAKAAQDFLVDFVASLMQYLDTSGGGDCVVTVLDPKLETGG